MRCAQINIFGMGTGLIVNRLGLTRIWSESKDKDYQIEHMKTVGLIFGTLVPSIFSEVESKNSKIQDFRISEVLLQEIWADLGVMMLSAQDNPR